jgi:isopenicillin-N N-acyltransferase-like protein
VTIPGLTIHRSDEGSPGDRGLALGRAVAGPVANTVAVYTRLFAEDMGLDGAETARLGHEVAVRLSATRPDLVDEIEGIAGGSGQEPDVLFAVNARTELLAGGARASGGDGECSTVARVAPNGGHSLLAQNWDFHPDLAGSRLVWIVERAGGWFATFTEAGIVAKTGLNSAGLATALNFLAASDDGGVDGIPVHVLLRMLLDECADADAADSLLRSARMSASACITVVADAAAGGGGGHATAYELSPAGCGAVEADEGRLAHTNHFLVPQAAVDVVLAGPGSSSTLRRLDQVSAGLRDVRDGTAVDDLGGLLSTEHGQDPVFRRGDPSEPWVIRSATLATVVYDVTERQMWIRAAGGPGAALAEVELPAT